MRIGPILRYAMLAWVVSEVVILTIFVHAIGWSGAILLGVGTTCLGVIQLRRIGSSVAAQLQEFMSGGRSTIVQSDLTLSTVGALLLVVPGFLSDFAGLLLGLRSTRSLIRARFQTQQRSASDGVLDLDPRDWREASDPRQRIS